MHSVHCPISCMKSPNFHAHHPRRYASYLHPSFLHQNPFFHYLPNPSPLPLSSPMFPSEPAHPPRRLALSKLTTAASLLETAMASSPAPASSPLAEARAVEVPAPAPTLEALSLLQHRRPKLLGHSWMRSPPSPSLPGESRAEKITCMR